MGKPVELALYFPFVPSASAIRAFSSKSFDPAVPLQHCIVAAVHATEIYAGYVRSRHLRARRRLEHIRQVDA
jgi:hypothetical protein